MESAADAYAVLGIAEGCGGDEARRAYRRAVQRYKSESGASKDGGQLSAATRLRIVNQAVFAIGQDLTQKRTTSGHAHNVDRALTPAELDAIIPASTGEGPVGDALDPLLATLLASAGGLLIGRSAPVGRVPSGLELGVGLLACGFAMFVVFRHAWRRR